MASQIAHIIYTQKYFERLESGDLLSRVNPKDEIYYPTGKINRDEFILGATFPDIRRIDEGVRRKDTHLKFYPINLNFSSLSSFEAGWKFHLFCDMKREEILNKYNFYSLPHTTDMAHFPPKILEDKLCYDSYNNWEKLNSLFNNPPYIENLTGISRETFKLWYAILAKYIEKKPDTRAMRIFLVKQPSHSSRVGEIMTSIAKLEENKKAVKILNKVREEIV